MKYYFLKTLYQIYILEKTGSYKLSESTLYTFL